MRVSSKFLIGAAIGSGNTGLAAERGGADFLLAINAGRLRTMGAPSIACMLPILDAGALTERFAREELLTQCRIPVLLGVNAWEEACDPAAKAEAVRAAGFAGAVNFPSCMHYSRPLQQILGRAGRGIETEVALLRAVQDAGLTAMFYCGTRTQARLAADAGIDMVLLNLGWNVGGALGHRRRETLEEVATRARDVGRLIKRINPKTLFFLEGGPISTAEDLGRVAGLAPIDGYVGGSTFERMPLEASVADQIDRFRRASRRGASLDAESARLVGWSRRYGFAGRAPAQLDFLRRLKAVASTVEPVLVLAEKGLETGPTLRALLGEPGPERSGAIREIDLAGEDFPARARSLLFGPRDGAARTSPALADPTAGLLVLRAPERLPAVTQRRLARALRERRFQASGSRRVLSLGPRVVLISRAAVTNGTSAEDLAAAGLEPSLAAVLAGWTLRPPPLRERIEDLMTVLAVQAGESFDPDFSLAATKALQAHLWPGNEAELRSVLGALAGRADPEPVRPDELRPLLQQSPVRETRSRSEKDRIVDALWRHGFNRTRTAAALGMSRKTLYNKIQRFGLSG
ncbi:MAG: phosphoenolpyruvate hydrolase family protein [Kiloniellales bacterium]|nr:phosphoenolpyruvate hydrolase family protein [Kiloniellales bacterium]